MTRLFKSNSRPPDSEREELKNLDIIFDYLLQYDSLTSESIKKAERDNVDTIYKNAFADNKYKSATNEMHEMIILQLNRMDSNHTLPPGITSNISDLLQIPSLQETKEWLEFMGELHKLSQAVIGNRPRSNAINETAHADVIPPGIKHR